MAEAAAAAITASVTNMGFPITEGSLVMAVSTAGRCRAASAADFWITARTRLNIANAPLFCVLGEVRTDTKHGADISRENVMDAR